MVSSTQQEGRQSRPSESPKASASGPFKAKAKRSRKVENPLARPEHVDLLELQASLRREKRRVHALESISIALGSTLDLDQILALLVSLVSELMEAERTTLYLLDEETGELWSKIAEGDRKVEFRLGVGEGVAGWVAAHGQCVHVPDAYSDFRFSTAWDKRTGYKTRNILCVPIRNQQGAIMGALQTLNKVTGDFLDEDETLLAALASQAAVSLENSKLFLSMIEKNRLLHDTTERLEKKVREQDLLFEIAQVSARSHDPNELLSGVLERAAEAVDAQAGFILMAEEGQHDLVIRTSYGATRRISGFEGMEGRVEPDKAITGWVAEHGIGRIVKCVEDDAELAWMADRLGHLPRSVLGVPLSWEGGKGVLELVDKSGDGDAFSESDLKLATMVAGHISTAIGMAENREKRAQQERLSVIGEFLSGILHDLKTPMSVIAGYVEMMAEEENAEARSKLARTVLQQTKRINAMTKETLAYVRGDRRLFVQKVYLKSFFEELAAQLELDLRRYRVRVHLDLQTTGVAYLDPHKLERAVHNLARNAAEAIASQQQVALRKDDPEALWLGTFRISVAQRADESIEMRFEDDGPGIPASVRRKLFRRFVTSGKREGTGLGLAMVHKVAGDHGGSVRVESTPGRTVFIMHLPNQSSPDEAAEESTR